MWLKNKKRMLIIMDFPLNALGLSHKIISERIKKGDFCIDATAGRGRDTAFLCRLCGKEGRVIAFDIQKEAVESTEKHLAENGLSAEVYLDSHANMDKYASVGEVDAVMFNFGWLPGGDHNCFSHSDSSIIAIKKAMELLKDGGIISICIYCGKENGFEEKNALLDFFKTIDSDKYTVIVCDFPNRAKNPPIPVFIIKDN